MNIPEASPQSLGSEQAAGGWDGVQLNSRTSLKDSFFSRKRTFTLETKCSQALAYKHLPSRLLNQS